MPDEDAKIFSEAFQIYNKYRWTEMKKEQWDAFTTEVRDFAWKYQPKSNVLATQMAFMLLDVFNELYKNGQKPPIPDYFGRSDLDGH